MEFGLAIALIKPSGWAAGWLGRVLGSSNISRTIRLFCM